MKRTSTQLYTENKTVTFSPEVVDAIEARCREQRSEIIFGWIGAFFSRLPAAVKHIGRPVERAEAGCRVNRGAAA